ncbi:MAG: hypothetical protein U0835_13715 [Isosphaeraceae bacterium]
MSTQGWVGWVRYGLPGLTLGLALAWFLGDRGPSARAQGTPPGAAGIPLPLPAAERSRPGAATPALAEGTSGGTIALTTSTGGAAQLLYLIDTKTRAFVIYRIDPTNPKGMVKLEAARQYQWDLKLDEYNNTEPKPAAIESAVRGSGSGPIHR